MNKMSFKKLLVNRRAEGQNKSYLGGGGFGINEGIGCRERV
jgi:hypothetical protein